jgi:hypothetical protein
MKNEITISTEEYKELVSKGVPNNQQNEWFKNKLEDLLLENFQIDGNKLDIRDNWRFCDDFEKWLRIIDKGMYKRIYNTLFDEKMKKENDKMKMEKVRANKEIGSDE